MVRLTRPFATLDKSAAVLRSDAARLALVPSVMGLGSVAEGAPGRTVGTGAGGRRQSCRGRGLTAWAVGFGGNGKPPGHPRLPSMASSSTVETSFPVGLREGHWR